MHSVHPPMVSSFYHTSGVNLPHVDGDCHPSAPELGQVVDDS